MKYISQINAFFDLITINPLSTGQVALWHALMHINNKCAWQEWFSASNQTLELYSGLSRQGVAKARLQLQQLRLIEFRSGNRNKQAASYKVCKLYTSDGVPTRLPTGCQSSVPTSGPTGLPTGSTLNRRDETSRDKIKKTANAVQTDPSCETEVESSAKNKMPYSQIIDEFHRICVSYRKVQQRSESRKKAIHARFSSGYAITDFIKLFELAEASDFLKGANQRNFTADFDWLIKDANMAKTLEGNYANRDQSAPNTGDSATGIPDGAITARRPKYGTIL